MGGSVVLGADGELELATGVVRGKDPLAPFGEAAFAQVSRADTYSHCADLMVNSLWEPATGEVAAFEELVGSHGGLGGDQTHPFLLYPADLPPPPAHLVDSEEVHGQLRRWLAHLGHEAFAAPRPDGSSDAAAAASSRRVEPSA
jgi:hypothetical protein